MKITVHAPLMDGNEDNHYRLMDVCCKLDTSLYYAHQYGSSFHLISYLKVFCLTVMSGTVVKSTFVYPPLTSKLQENRNYKKTQNI